MEAMHPWYRGFNGTIEEVARTRGRNTDSEAKSYQCSGIVNQLSDTTVEITELPIRKWTQDYKVRAVSQSLGLSSGKGVL